MLLANRLSFPWLLLVSAVARLLAHYAYFAVTHCCSSFCFAVLWATPCYVAVVRFSLVVSQLSFTSVCVCGVHIIVVFSFPLSFFTRSHAFLVSHRYTRYRLSFFPFM